MTDGTARREFLFLQGLAGPFFYRLGQALQSAGHGVHRVNFHGGDRLYWRASNAVDFRGSAETWPAYLDKLLAKRGITDLVLFGDCRPLHRLAIQEAGRRHIQVHVFEEGYIRPDWVTLEIGGVNGHSSLPRDPGYYLEIARGLPELQAMPAIPSTFRRRAREDLIYNLGGLLMLPLYPGYRTHRPWNILIEYAGWAARLARKPAARQRSTAALDGLMRSRQPYFVFPLQLNCDYQIRTHSRFPGMQDAIERIIGSFAANAPADTLLVVKAHPLDNGLIDWRRRTLAVAARHGLTERLVYVEEGDIATMMKGASGVVTINSTSGTLALTCGVPVITLGDAIYNVPRVTFQGELDQFWTNPTPPDAAVWDAFRRVLVQRCLVHGGFFSDEGLSRLIAASVARLEGAARVGVRAAAQAQPVPASRAMLVAAQG